MTWEGKISAVSQDAIRDAAWARSETVIDEWDEDFDRGKVGAGYVPGWGGGGQRQRTLCSDPKSLPASAQVKKIKLKQERRRRFNSFQELQNKRNFWSVTHPAKVAGLSHRL